MLENSFKTRLDALNQEIEDACLKYGRKKSEVNLIAVSKGHEISVIKEFYHLGVRDFGENYAQEFSAKLHDSEQQGLKIKWHYIGVIQSNKINLVAKADVVHSLSSIRHAELLDQAANKNIQCFLQVDLKGDRNGFSPSEVLSFLAKPWAYKNLEFCGLMTILPQDEQPASFWFQHMAELKKTLLKTWPKVELSMGMSADFIEAIAHGANYIRIGTRIFGERNYRR